MGLCSCRRWARLRQDAARVRAYKREIDCTCGVKRLDGILKTSTHTLGASTPTGSTCASQSSPRLSQAIRIRLRSSSVRWQTTCALSSQAGSLSRELTGYDAPMVSHSLDGQTDHQTRKAAFSLNASHPWRPGSRTTTRWLAAGSWCGDERSVHAARWLPADWFLCCCVCDDARNATTCFKASRTFACTTLWSRWRCSIRSQRCCALNPRYSKTLTML